MSRFASKCQQPDCGHPNTWIKVQMWVGNGLILSGLLWSFLHFQQHLLQGIEVPIIATALALAYRTALSMLKSFYGD